MSQNNLSTFQDMEPAQIFSLTGDQRVQTVIGKLKFISKIKAGEKINVRELFVRNNDSVLQRFLRSLKNYSTIISGSEVVESKEATLEFISNTVNDAINLISIYRKEKEDFHQKIADLIVNNLEISKDGIKNSIKTYREDRKFISHAEAVMQTLETRIKSLRNHGYMPDMTDSPFMPQFTDDEDEN